MELGHFDKHSPTTQGKKAPQEKNIRFFRLETLPIHDHNQGIFFLKFFQFLKRAGETSPPPPSSYAPATVYCYHELKYFISNCDTKHNVIGIFERWITKLRPYLLNIVRKKNIHMITNSPNDLWE